MKSTKKKEQLPAARCDLHSSRSAIPSVCDKDFGLHHHSLPSAPPLFFVNPPDPQLFPFIRKAKPSIG